LMRLIDQQFLLTPFYGSRRMTACLEKCGLQSKRVPLWEITRHHFGESILVGPNALHFMLRAFGSTRMRHGRVTCGTSRLKYWYPRALLLTLEALFPRPRTTTAALDARVYPYLLRDRELTHADEVWSSDITYVPMRRGFMYLTAVIDWYSRYVLSWRLSNTLEGRFCLEALDEALSRARPEIFNTDQGSQFTSREYTGRLEEAGIAVSRDGRGRALDNVFVERLWRSVKYEDIYINEYDRVPDLESGLTAYFQFYDEERPHQSLDYQTPGEVYRGEVRGG